MTGRPPFSPISRGFTLIELLVVIAIIGMLASIVLVALGSTRNKGNDAAIKSNLSTIRSQAEVYAINNGNSYGSFNGDTVPTLTGSGSVCLTQTTGNLFADPTIKSAMTAAQRASGNVMTCYSNGNSWAVLVALRLPNAGSAWCADSTGFAGVVTTASQLSNALHTCQ